MEEEITDYFNKVFKGGLRNSVEILNLVRSKVVELQNNILTALVSLDEVKTTAFDMQPEKSPGPDGLNLTFYQKYWHVVEEDV